MALDPALILQGQTPNMGEAFQKGAANQAAINTSQAQLPGVQADSQLKQAALPYQIQGDKLDQAIKENQLGVQLISSVTDQKSLDAALQTAQKYGIDTSRFPQTYDPHAIQQMAMGALQMKDRLEMMYKNIEIAQKDRSFNAEYPNADPSGNPKQTPTSGGTLGSPSPPASQPTQPADQGSITIPPKPSGDAPLPIDGTQDAVPLTAPPGGKIVTPQPTNQGDAMLRAQPGAQQYASNATPADDASMQTTPAADDFQPYYNAKGEPVKGVSDGTQIYINPKTGERQEMLPKGDAIFNKSGAPANLHGDDYLKTIPDPVHRAYLKAVTDGSIPLTAPRGKAEQQAQMDLVTAAKQVDPTFYAGRADAVKDFRSGDQAKQIATFSKGIEHLDTLSALAQNLNNTKSPTFNALANEVSKQTGSAKVTNFNAAKEIVAKELDKAIAGAGGSTISGTEDAKAQLEAASSPEQLAGAIATIQNLMGGQLKGIEQTYKTSVGGDGFASLLTPKAAEVFSKYEKADNVPKYDSGLHPDAHAVQKGYTAAQIKEYKQLKGIK